jgi:hypothetical protein
VPIGDTGASGVSAHDPDATTVAVVLLVGGIALCGYAGYLQYVVLPEEHTPGQRGKRAGVAAVGLVLALLGSWLLT